MVLQLSNESGAGTVISFFFFTFFAVAMSLFGEVRHTLARWPALPHDRHLLELSNLHLLDLCPVHPQRKHFPCSC